MAFGDSGTRTIVSGVGACRISLAVAVAVGDPIAYSSGWTPADANAAKPAMLVAGEAGGVGAIITAYVAAVVEGFTGGTAGNLLYLSDTVNKYSDSASTTSKQVCGQMLTATCAYVAPQRFEFESFTVSHQFAAAGVTNTIFVAPFRCKVVKISESHGTASGATGTLEVERLQGTEAPGGNGDALLGATKIDLNGTANTVQSPALTDTGASLILEAGNRIGMTLATGENGGSLANAIITVEFVRA
jgi:hypothetical protein